MDLKAVLAEQIAKTSSLFTVDANEKNIFYDGKQLTQDTIPEIFGVSAYFNVTPDYKSVEAMDFTNNKITFYFDPAETNLQEEILKHVLAVHANPDSIQPDNADTAPTVTMNVDEVGLLLKAEGKPFEQLDAEYPNWKEIFVFEDNLREFVYKQMEKAFQEQMAANGLTPDGCDCGKETCEDCKEHKVTVIPEEFQKNS